MRYWRILVPTPTLPLATAAGRDAAAAAGAGAGAGAAALAGLPKDSDGDGLTDDEEAKLGTDPFNKDTDGDGRSNAMERRAGTDPLDDRDRLAILSADGGESASGAMVVRWTSVPGQIYNVLWTPRLEAGFRLLASGILATQTECTYAHPWGEAGAGFFMIQLQD